MKIEITKYLKAVPKEGRSDSIVAYFNMRVFFNTWWYYNSMKLFQKNGHYFITFPSMKYEKNNETKYTPYMGIEERKSFEDFQEEVLQAIDSFEGNIPKSCEDNAPF